ncbi:MAG: hypothetical protein GX265_05515 [Mollicutes bacterium]|nr:hypothetical protein [Mollicutes bacterium]
MEFELNKKNIILLIILVIVFSAGILLHNYRNPVKENKKTEKITLVKDYSRFFTISNAGNKYIQYLKNKDKDNLIILLNESYLTLNDINENNVLEKLTLLSSGNYSFEARKMYQENKNKNLIRYYIKGDLTKEVMDEYQRPTDYYLIIDLDIKNMTFSVTPYDGKLFKEAK